MTELESTNLNRSAMTPQVRVLDCHLSKWQWLSLAGSRTNLASARLSYVEMVSLLYFLPFFLAVIQALVALVHDPEPEHPLRGELAEEYTKDKKKFMRNAEEHTKKHAEKRP